MGDKVGVWKKIEGPINLPPDRNILLRIVTKTESHVIRFDGMVKVFDGVEYSESTRYEVLTASWFSDKLVVHPLSKTGEKKHPAWRVTYMMKMCGEGYIEYMEIPD